jgi:hypothetical protein
MKIKAKTEKIFSKWLYSEYIRRKGYGIRNINNCEFYTTQSHEHLPQELYKIDGSGPKTYIGECARELEKKKLVMFCADNMKFFITEEGYWSFSRNRWQKIQEYLNKNPGTLSAIALVTSIASLIVAVMA